MSFSLPTPIFQQQPAFLAGISLGHPLARNLRFAGYSASGRFYDAVSRQASTQGSTANRAARRTIDGNLGLAFEAKTTQMTFPAFSTGFDQIAGPCTIFVEGSVLTNNTSQNVAESFSGSSGDGFGLKFDDNNQVTNGFFTFINNSNSTPSNFDVLGANSETFRHRVMYTLDGVNAKLYANGKLDVSSANSNLPLADITRQTRILTGTGGSAAIVLVWDRVLALEEFQQLFFNPWQVFLAPRKRFTLQRISGSPQSLTGVFFGSLEKYNTGAVNFTTSVSGDSIKSAEKPAAGSLVVGGVSLSGSNIKSSEKYNVGGISSLPYTAIWEEKFGTNLGSVKPATAPLGSGTYTRVMSAWSTAAFGGGFFMIVAQGGHTDYAGNERYGLSVPGYVPVLLGDTASNAIIAGSSTIESSGCYATAPTGNVPDDQEPRARHGYDQSQWCSVKSKYALIGAAGFYIGAGGESVIRYYDPLTDTWETGPSLLTPFDGPYSATCEDSSGNLWFGGVGTGARLNKIVPSTGVVTDLGDIFMSPLSSYYRTGIHDPVQNFFWVFGGDGAGGIQVGYWDLNDTSGRIEFTNVTPTGATTILGQPAPGVAWYAADSKFVLWSGGTSVAVFDPITHVATLVSMNPNNTVTPSAAQANGTYGRFRAIGPDLFLGVNSMDENFFQLHLRGVDQSVSGQNVPSSSKLNVGTVAAGAVSISGQNIPSKEQEFLASVAIATSGLSGQSINSDFRSFDGTLSALYAIIGSFVVSAEKENQSVISSLTALVGQFGGSLEKFNGGSLAAIVALLGQTIASIEKDNNGSIAPGGVTLSGQSIGSLEKNFPGTLASIIALVGQSVASMEKLQIGVVSSIITITSQFTQSQENTKVASVSVGAVNISGSNIASQEKFFQSILGLAGAILSGVFSPSSENGNVSVVAPGSVTITGLFTASAEREFLASVTLAGALVGANILSMEKFQQAVLSLGAVSLAGANIPSAEKGNIGLVNTGLSIAGSFSKEMERDFAASITSLIGMVGSGVKSDEQFRTSVISTLRSIVGSSSQSMEQDKAGIIQAAFNILGQNIVSSQKTNLSVITPSIVTVLGSSSQSSEKDNIGTVGANTSVVGSFSQSQEQDIAGRVARITNILGDHVDSIEQSHLSILTLGALTIVGQYSSSMELISVSTILNGGILDTIQVINADAPFETDIFADAPFETDLEVQAEFV